MYPLAQRTNNKPQNWRAGLLQFAVANCYFGFSLGSNFSSFEIKQREILLNQRLKIVAIGEICHVCINTTEIS